MSFPIVHSEAADRAAQGPRTGQQLQAINQHLGKVGEEVRIMFPVLNLCRASSVNAEAKLNKRGAGPELCTKPGQGELKVGAGNSFTWLHNSRESVSFFLWPLQGVPLLPQLLGGLWAIVVSVDPT